MKRKLVKVLSLLMALAMLTGLASLALSEEINDVLDEGLGLDVENTEGLDIDQLPSGLEALDLSLDGFDLVATVTYRFYVNDVEYASQTAQAGE